MRGTSRRIRFGLAVALVITGCAHAAPSSRQPQQGSNEPSPAPVPEHSGTAAAEPSTSTPSTPDPSEQITAEELATIPDPIPGATAEPAPVEPPSSPPASSPAPPEPTGDATRWIWRVQIFASPDRAQAERAAREASSRLGESYVIDVENSLYKVRLGAFTNETDAEPLKRKAVLEGYTGAFRVRALVE